MKRLLFSSFLGLFLTSSSCSDQNQASPAGEEAQEMEARKTEVMSAPKVATDSLGARTVIETKTEVHSPGVPDQHGLDSIKNSYPKKR